MSFGCTKLILTILSALAQDESRSISDNIRWSIQKKFQRGEAMVDLSRMLGYDKGENGEWVINPKQAEIVRYIFERYVCGVSATAIAKELNAMGKKTVRGSIWRADAVLFILRNEKYVGDCESQKTVTKNFLTHEVSINEGDAPKYYVTDHHVAIIDRHTWNQAQMMLSERKRLNVRAAPSQEILRYSGLLRCADCGRAMFGRRIHLKNGERIVYVCSTYNRYGKEHCSQHQIDESVLDKLIMDELRNTKALYQQNWDALERLIAQWTPKAELTGAQIVKLEKRIRCLEDETEAILMERIRDRANAERYDRMIQKREEEIAAAKKQIEELQNISAVLRERQAKFKRDISMIDDILAEGAMTEAHLRMLVEKIYVQETDGKLSLDIQIKAPFRTHLDVYENGVLTEQYGELDFDWDRLAHLIYGETLVG